ncbi:beta-glucosidase [Agaricicola taiwanensis]|uniref:Beta-glucosidase n=2 Tax=Agaricicola taiwanensis TaxID=591372 RepID=A0A8J2VKP3_9RHOB|nr:beta-glucosidase [Agaricicola taiwanensis]
MPNRRIFNSFFLGGFECSSHRRPDGRRLDLLSATGHDRMTDADYRQLSAHGMAAVRDGLRWHLIESAPGHYDWSSFLPMLRSAEALGTQVVWDLCHYGWPDHLDIWSKDFPDHFGRFAAAVARLVRDETGPQAFYCPVNEISYWAWAGAEVGRINPCAVGRAGELKRQLVRSAIAAIEAIRAEDPTARFITAEPLINVVSGSPEPQHIFDAEQYRLSQFEAVDLLTGRIEPGLGGRSDYLDVVGINFYPDNQWYLGGSTIPLGHHAYRPLSEMLEEVQARYGRPILIAETGAEGSARPAWLHYIGAEVRDARARGISVEGICLYPVLDYPGWENERLCQVGLLGEAEGWEKRSVCVRTASELRRQQALFEDVAAPEPATAAE